jgi:hypothetical protein
MVHALLPNLVRPEQHEQILETMSAAELDAISSLRLNLHALVSKNPTGRYMLDLSRPSDRRVLSHLWSISHEESQLPDALTSSETADRGPTLLTLCRCDACLAGDTSQNGDFQPRFRNLMFEHQPLASFGPSWRPRRWEGLLEFDFISQRIPESTEQSIDEYEFEHLADALAKTQRCVSHAEREFMPASRTPTERRPEMDALSALYTVCGGDIPLVSAAQAARLILRFPPGERRIDAAQKLFRRVLDRVQFMREVMEEVLSKEERQSLVRRLGWLSLFDAAAPPTWRYTFDLRVRDARCAAASLVMLSWKCPGRRWMNGLFNGKRFSEPALWVSRMPRTGVLEVTYRDSPDKPRLAAAVRVVDLATSKKVGVFR